MSAQRLTAVAMPGLAGIRDGIACRGFGKSYSRGDAVILIAAEGLAGNEVPGTSDAGARVAVDVFSEALNAAVDRIGEVGDPSGGWEASALVTHVRECVDPVVPVGWRGGVERLHRVAQTLVIDDEEADSTSTAPTDRDAAGGPSDIFDRYDCRVTAAIVVSGWQIFVYVGDGLALGASLADSAIVEDGGAGRVGRRVVARVEVLSGASGARGLSRLTQEGGRADSIRVLAVRRSDLLVGVSTLVPVRLDDVDRPAIEGAAHVALALPGASHVRGGGIPCQDAARTCTTADGITVLALADGHGDKKYTRSDIGARIAVDVVHDVVTDAVRRLRRGPARENGTHADVAPDPCSGQAMGRRRDLERVLRERLPRLLVHEWNRRVQAHAVGMSEAHPSVTADAAQQDDGRVSVTAYGSTMLGAAWFDGFLLMFKLGDGEIVLATKHEATRVFQAKEKAVDSATESLTMLTAADPENFEVSVTEATVCEPFLLLLCSDGVSDAYIPADEVARRDGLQEEFPKIWGRNVLDRISESGWEPWIAQLPTRLARLSQVGVGDDVSVAALYWQGSAGVPAMQTEEDGAVAGTDLPARPVQPDAAEVRGPTTLQEWLAEQAEDVLAGDWIRWTSDLPRRLTVLSEAFGGPDMVCAFALGDTESESGRRALEVRNGAVKKGTTALSAGQDKNEAST